jgi:hypothetical protein
MLKEFWLRRKNSAKCAWVSAALVGIAALSPLHTPSLPLPTAEQRGGETLATQPPSPSLDPDASPAISLAQSPGWLSGESVWSEPIPEFEGTVIDDLSAQFTLQGPEQYWKEATQGYNGHFWWTKNNDSLVENTARWVLPVSNPGKYDVYIYIPESHTSTHQAKYSLQHNGKTSHLIVNQAMHPNSWYRLGSFDLSGSGGEYVQLSDATGEPDGQFEIGFDAVGFAPAHPAASETADQVHELQDKVWEMVKPHIQPWLERQQAELETQFDRWIQEQKLRILRELQQAVSDWLEQQCVGSSAALTLPLFTLILWRRKRNKP